MARAPAGAGGGGSGSGEPGGIAIGSIRVTRDITSYVAETIAQRIGSIETFAAGWPLPAAVGRTPSL